MDGRRQLVNDDDDEEEEIGEKAHLLKKSRYFQLTFLAASINSSLQKISFNTEIHGVYFFACSTLIHAFLLFSLSQ